ncbi:MAG: glycine--tRNA ligase subunit beta [Betaproteobacteria bacterium]|nr:glycine--tRNA ligase subunit beta [Betaproteobacteria bacterium]
MSHPAGNATRNATGNLLVELLVEELPPKSLKKLGDSFAESMVASLRTQGLASDDSVITSFASPRRLAVHIRNVALQAPDKSVSHRLMPVAVGLDKDGQPTPALRKKLGILLGDSAAVSVSQLKRALDGKAEALFFDSIVPGARLDQGLQKALDEALANLPIARMMTYQLGDGWTTVDFVRPAHGLVALHGAEVVPAGVLGLTAGRETQGHRFESRSSPIVLADADSYAQQLEGEGAVIASFAERREEIVRQLSTAAEAGLKPVDDPNLLDEVTALVERPNVLVGEFESEFLDVPQECLILTMKVNQKYFPLLDSDGKLSHKFLIVSNIRPADASRIIAGNERVLRSRLADAKFFFDQDRKKTLASRVEGLREVVYHNKLGTQADRVERIWAIAQAIGLRLGGNELAAKAGEAAMLSKADLLTGMVNEFPELQGIMGGHYARHDGLAEDVANAIEDHYKPRFAGDGLPRNMVGICAALADKLETLTGMFGIGQIPTGDKDPFALRRHALGIIRILIEKELPLPLDNLLDQASGTFGHRISDASAALSDFIYERLRHYFSMESLDEEAVAGGKHIHLNDAKDRLGFSPQQIDAVLALRPQRLDDIKKRLGAVRAFASLPEAESLAATNKRVGNILKKAGIGVAGKVDAALLQAPAEHALHQTLSRIMPQADAAFAAGDYSGSLQLLAALKQPVDDFFDHVMVNVEDEVVRNNRQALLAQLHRAMNRVADISRLAV